MGHFSKDGGYGYNHQFVEGDKTFSWELGDCLDEENPYWQVRQSVKKNKRTYVSISGTCADFTIHCGFGNDSSKQEGDRDVVPVTIYNAATNPKMRWNFANEYRWRSEYLLVLADILQTQKKIASGRCPDGRGCLYSNSKTHYHPFIKGEVVMLPPVVEHDNPLYVFLSCFFGDEYEQYSMEQRIELIEKHLERCEKLKLWEPSSYINYLLSSPADKWNDHLEKVLKY